MLFTNHFKIYEFFQSTHANSCPYRNMPVTPSELGSVITNLANLAFNLETLRSVYGRPITITSGYRSEYVNNAVGGVANSHHRKGLAVDITGDNYNELKTAVYKCGCFSKIIPYDDRKFLHVEV